MILNSVLALFVGGWIWFYTGVSALFTAVGEAYPFKSFAPRFWFFQVATFTYSLLLEANFRRQEHQIPVIALVMVWTVINALGTGAFTIYFNFAVFRQLPAQAYVFLAMMILLSLFALYCGNRFLSFIG